MKLLYASKKIESCCKDTAIAKKFFNGNEMLALSLLSKINSLKSACTLHDIIVQPHFHFHKLINKRHSKLEGYFAIDIKSRRDKWRLILEPLDDDEQPFNPCHIDKIAKNVKIISIQEVSNHYE